MAGTLSASEENARLYGDGYIQIYGEGYTTPLCVVCLCVS